MGVTEFYENVYGYGIIRYFKGKRLYNDKALYEFNKGKIKAKELVTFDTSLMDVVEISKEEIETAKMVSEQILALIVRPEIEPNFSKYRQAVNAQLDLAEQFPEESHAYCEIVEIWRMLSNDEYVTAVMLVNEKGCQNDYRRS